MMSLVVQIIIVVDPNEVKGYQQIIERPIDLGTISANIQNGIYACRMTSEHSTDDVLLVILKGTTNQKKHSDQKVCNFHLRQLSHYLFLVILCNHY